MKKAVRRTLSVTVAAAMAMGLMTGCSSGKGEQKPAGEASGPQGQAADSGKQAGAAGGADHHQVLGRKLAGSRMARGGGDLEPGTPGH